VGKKVRFWLDRLFGIIDRAILYISIENAGIDPHKLFLYKLSLVQRLPLSNHYLSLHCRVVPRPSPCQVSSIRSYTNIRSPDANWTLHPHVHPSIQVLCDSDILHHLWWKREHTKSFQIIWVSGKIWFGRKSSTSIEFHKKLFWKTVNCFNLWNSSFLKCFL